jgi:phospholipid/cholesterol/gamma-HCH transport system substrate-binding protein
VVYDNVTGLVKSSQVTINGMKVGQVEDIGMLTGGDVSKILVTLIVINTVQLPMGTEALITSQDLLGTKAIDIKIKKDATTYYITGDTLRGINEESLTTSISKMVSPLKEKSEQVLVTLDKILMSMNDVFDSSGTQRMASGIHDLSSSLHSLRNLTERLDKLSEEEYDKLKAMLVSAESIVHNLKNNNDVINRSLKNIAQISDSIAAADLTRTINNTSRVMKEFASTLDKVNHGEGSLGKLVNDDALYLHLDATSRDLDSLLKDMQDYPGRYFTISAFGGNKRADKADKKRAEDRKKKTVSK